MPHTPSALLAELSDPSPRRLAVRLKPAAERCVRQGHPWVFDASVVEASHAGDVGDLAVIFDRRGRFVAVGLWDPASPIRVRVLAVGQPTTIDAAWLGTRLAAALGRRAALAATGTDGFRLLHGEGDGLPGLAIDRYAADLVIKLYSAAWLPQLKRLVPELLARVPAERLVLRASRAVAPALVRAGLADGAVVFGPPLAGGTLFRENGLVFEADLRCGHKTGFFLDQRDNRARVERLARGARVLDVFAYSGGFSLYAARGGARSVVALDASRPALAAARRNFDLNPAHKATELELHPGDAFVGLAALAAAGRRFDLVVADPPAFATNQAEVPRALAAYARLTAACLAVLERGGRLVIGSCSSRVPAGLFFETVRRAASEFGVELEELERSGHAIDHPIGVPETAYLKCLFAAVHGSRRDRRPARGTGGAHGALRR